MLGAPQTFVDGARTLAENMGDAGFLLPAQSLQPTGVFDGAGTPLTSLDATFVNQSAVGEWTLYIGSSQGGDLGEVESWTLHIVTGSDPVPANSPAGTVALTAALLLGTAWCVFRRQATRPPA